MRTKKKRALALALVTLLTNIMIYVLDQYQTKTSGDILRQPAPIASLGPALPPEDLEEQLLQKQHHHHYLEPKYNNTNTTINRSRSPQVRGVRRKPDSVADKFLFHSYLRGGGSTVAEILNLHLHEVFYLHQPLFMMDQEKPQSGIELINPKKIKESIRWLQDIYNCSFEYREEYLHEPYLWKSHSIRHTYRKECQHIPLIECIERACKQRSLRATLTLRLGVDYIYQLIKTHGNKFKVIVILRDPRAVLSTRRIDKLGVPLNSLAAFREQASKLCATMKADLRSIQKINDISPGSMMVLLYEHFLSHPSEVIAYLYDFLGLEVSSDQILDILKILQLDLPEENLLQLTKAWQLELTLQESRAVDKGCENHYEELGYFPVPNNINAYNKYFINWDQARESDYS